MAVKTRATRYANRIEGILAGYRSGRWLGVVPKSTALMNHCKQRNYGTNETYAQVRRQRVYALKLGFNWRDALA